MQWLRLTCVVCAFPFGFIEYIGGTFNDALKIYLSVILRLSFWLANFRHHATQSLSTKNFATGKIYKLYIYAKDFDIFFFSLVIMQKILDVICC
jgi:hypothetical protein